MSPAKLCSVLALFYSIVIKNANAIEDPIFNINGDAKIELILEKMGAPKSAILPVVYKKNEKEIKITEYKDKERIITIEFSPAESLTFKDKDLFEKIEENNSGDTINKNLIIADPKSGRIWKLTTELKVSEFDLVKPWIAKNKLLSLKDILASMGQTTIIKKKAESKK